MTTPDTSATTPRKSPIAGIFAIGLALACLAGTAWYLRGHYDLANLGQMDLKTLLSAGVVLHGGLTAALVAFIYISGRFPRRATANAIATLAALFTATTVMFFSVFYLREPQIALDWAVMFFSGIVSAIFVFFIVWGHFQQGLKEAEAPKPTAPPVP